MTLSLKGDIEAVLSEEGDDEGFYFPELFTPQFY
jgi:hypothetical protein